MLESSVINIIPQNSGVQVVACPHPFKVHKERINLAAGLTVGELLAQVQPIPELRLRAHIYVNDEYIPVYRWGQVLQDGDNVVVRVVPGEPISTFLATTMILGVTLKTIISTISIILTIVSLGMMLMNALISPPTPTSSGGRKEETTQFIQGSRNKIDPFGTIARPLGRIRVTPRLGAMPYTEVCGKEQYLRMIFCWGYGPLEIEDLRIGQTPIASFQDVEINTYPNYPDNNNDEEDEGEEEEGEFPLFPWDVYQEDLAIVLKRRYTLNKLTITVDAAAKTFTRSAGDWLKDNKDNDIVTVGHRINFSGFADSENNGQFVVSNATELVLTFETASGLKNVTADTDIIADYDPWEVRTTRPLADEISVDVTFFKGLYRSNDEGGLDSIDVDLRLQYRLADTLWDGSNIIVLNEFRRPIIYNGFFRYEATSIGSAPHRTGATQPAWPRVIGQTVVDGDITWTCCNPGWIIGPPFEYSATPANFWDKWTDFPDSDSNIKGHTTQAVRCMAHWRVPRDQGGGYEVAIKRVTKDRLSFRVGDEATWTALRTVTHEEPIAMTGLALTVVRIRASNQLSGVIDELNGVVTTICPDWVPVDLNAINADTDGMWMERETQNPASLYRHVLEGPANARPLSVNRIDLLTLQKWHVKCAREGMCFNGETSGSVWEVLRQIAAAGRATPGIGDFGLRTVIMDEPQDTPVQHFTPRNSWDFSSEKVFVDMPHALRITFSNEDKDWQVDELFVGIDLPVWKSSVVISPKDFRRATSGTNKNKYECISGGITGATEPSWPEIVDNTVSDGTVTWRCKGTPYYYDADSATKYESLEFVGITDPLQIWKMGRYHLAVAQLRPETYSFSVDFEHLVCGRGDLILVSHDVTLQGLGAGRVKEVLYGYVEV